MSRSIDTAVREEIEALHEFFVGWSSGDLPGDAFDAAFLDHMDPAFRMITPEGAFIGLDAIQNGLRRSHGQNRNFRIAIRDVQVHRVMGRHVLATYQEWQRNALASKPPDNARISSVIFSDTESLRWLHLHESWLPESVAAAGPYDF